MKNHRFFPITLVMLIVSCFSCYYYAQAAEDGPQQKQNLLQPIWEQAEILGKYRFQTNITQVIRPLPTAANIGASSSSSKLYIDGLINKPSDYLQMELYSSGGSIVSGQGAVEIKIENGQAFGRVNQEEWEVVDDFTNLFAPSHDPLGFLLATTNAVDHGEDEIGRHITFDIDGVVLAEQIKRQMVQELADNGALPAGLNLELPQQYVDLVASGELWADEQNRPLRQIIHLQFPPESQHQISAEIASNFTEWGELPAPQPWAALDLSNLLQQASINQSYLLFALTLGSGFAAIVGLLILFRRHIYPIVAYTLIVVILVSPFLQAKQLEAFHAYVARTSHDHDSNAQMANGEANFFPPVNPPFNPNKNPLAATSRRPALQTGGDRNQQIIDDGTDTDGDGLPDSYETSIFKTDPNLADSDNDSLDDGTELNELGTDPLQADTDGDGLTDAAEVKGFLLAGRTWYLDPLALSSKGDGQPDGFGCTENSNHQLDCVNTDGDDIPDIFDIDSDNDGVPDKVDNASLTYIGDRTDGLAEQTFTFDLDGAEAGQSMFVDLQLRPTNPDHLWYSLSVLDWPTTDHLGQVQRVFTSTLGTQGSAANGDMRLVPMLEVELTGTNLPLPLTTPQTGVSLSKVVSGTQIISGTVDFIQNGANINLDFALGAGTYDASIFIQSCQSLPEDASPVHRFDAADGDKKTVANKQLATTLGDGKHAIRLTNSNGDSVCRNIPNIVNGPYADKMVDAAALQVYGIIAREKEETGNILMIVPLVLLYDEVGSSPVAFTARLFYHPETANFDATTQSRLLWAVQAKTDHCSDVPPTFDADPERKDETQAERQKIWCQNKANWSENPPSIIHTYYDDWYLTGMQVQRNLGMKTAIVYQDPAYTTSSANSSYIADGFHDDNLWRLAQGLDVSLLSGRSSDTVTRDLTIDDLQSRWDKNSNSASSSAQRWEIPQEALVVERFDYDSGLGIADLAQNQSYKVLDTHFSPQVATGVKDPTLLFVRETQTRIASIDLTEIITTTSGSNSLTLNIDHPDYSPETTVASLNWVPYQYSGANWKPYPLEQYWQDKGEDIEAALARNLPANQVGGASLLARVFYFSLIHGSNRLVKNGTQVISTPVSIADVEMVSYLNPSDSSLTLGIGAAIFSVTEKSLKLIKSLLGKQVFIGEKGGFRNLSNSASGIKSTLIGLKRQAVDFSDVDDITFKDIQDAYDNKHDLLSKSKINSIVKRAQLADGLANAALLVNAVAATAKLLSAVSKLAGRDVVAKIFDIIGKSFSAVGATLYAAATIAKITTQIALKGAKSTLKVELSKGKASLIFLIITTTVSVGLFIFTIIASSTEFLALGFNQQLADLIATIYISVLFFALALTGVGAIVVAIISLIDAIVGLICGLTQPDGSEGDKDFRNYVCGGISGLLSKFVSWVIYDQIPAVELDRADRLNLTNFQFDVITPTIGLAAGNRLLAQIDVESALYRNDVDNAKEASPYEIWRLLLVNDSTLKSTTLVYRLDPDMASGKNMSDNLAVGTLNSWAPPQSEASFAADSNFVTRQTITGTSNLLEAGVNQPISFYLTEGQAYYTMECAVGICWLRETKDDLHIDLSSIYTFDIFPATVTEFRQLQLRDNGRFALEWDSSFPALQDADGDGLRSIGFGGIDPDDSSPDTDQDGLSDFYEINYSNSDPTQKDSDRDGLCDGQEVYYKTDPNRADSDRDGLADSEEFWHLDSCDSNNNGVTDEWVGGWEIVYGFDGNTPLVTRVNGDPLIANKDGDAYLDGQERLYSFNPNVSSSEGVLSINSILTSGSNVAQPNSTLQYSVTLANQLDQSYALGLLDVEFGAADGSQTVLPAPFNLRPSQSQSSIGSVTISPLAQSRAVTLTNVAGALISNPIEAVGGRSLWLKFNAPNLFNDSSLNQQTATCTNCPTADTGYRRGGARFAAGNALQVTDEAQKIGLNTSGFTLDLWIKSITTTNQSLTFFNAGSLNFSVNRRGIFRLRDENGIRLLTSPIRPFLEWNRITWSYDQKTKTSTFFADGRAFTTLTADLTSLIEASLSAPVSISKSGAGPVLVDEYTFYPFPLDDSQVAAINKDRVFYLQGETNFSAQPGTITDDSLFKNVVHCYNDTSNPTTCPTPSDNGGIINRYYPFRNSDSTMKTVPLETAPSPNLDLSRNNGEFSIALWADPTDNPGGGGSGWVMGGESNYTYPSLYLERQTGGDPGDPDSLVVSGGIQNGTDSCKFTGTAPADFGWHHIAVTFDGRFQLYLNNVPITVTHRITSTNTTNCGTIKPQSADQFIVGGRGEWKDSKTNFDGQPYNGYFDELQIFNYTLSPQEIANVYWDDLPILDYRFDEPPSSQTFADHSRSRADGSCSGNGCPISGLPGRDNQSVYFDGVNNKVTLPTAGELGIANSSFTLAAWVNPTAKGSTAIIGNSQYITDTERIFFGFRGNAPEFQLGNSQLFTNTADLVPLNQWSHIVGRYRYDSRNIGNSELSIFVNGKLVGTRTGVLPHTAASTALALGYHRDRSRTQYFNGMVDMLQIYREALTNEEIRNLTRQAPLINLHLDERVGATGFVNSGQPQLVAKCTSQATCPQSGIKGRVYQGVVFDGTDQTISVVDRDNLLDVTQLAVGAWVKPTQKKKQSQTIIGRGSGSNKIFSLDIEPDSMKVKFSAKPGCGTLESFLSQTTMIEDRWNHLMATYDPEDGKMALYINGSLDSTLETGSNGPLCASVDPLVIGGFTSSKFIGELDEAVFYDAILSNKQVLELYQYQQAWFDIQAAHRIIIDADQPTVSLDVMAPYFPNRDKILAISAFDPTSAIQSVEYNIDGSGWQAATPDAESWLFSFNPNGERNYEIELRATDQAGNVGTGRQTLAVDASPPILSPINIEGLTAVPVVYNPDHDTFDVVISGTVSTTGSPLKDVTVDLFDESGHPVSGQLEATVSGTSWLISYPFLQSPNGPFAVSVKAADLINNSVERQTQIHIDGTVPDTTLEISGTTDYVIDTNQMIRGTISETGAITSGVRSLSISYYPLDLNGRSIVADMQPQIHLALDNHADPAQSPVNRYPDTVNVGRFAVCTACPASGGSGVLGNAPIFDGLDDQLAISTFGAGLQSAGLSFGGWVYPTVSKATFPLAANTLTTFELDGLGIELRHAEIMSATALGQIQLLFNDQVSDVTVSSAQLDWNSWSHVMVAISAGGQGTLYLNGEAVGSFTTSVRPLENGQLLIGSNAPSSSVRVSAGTTAPFRGRIDDVTVFNRLLTTVEVADIYRGSYPVLHLPFDDVEYVSGNRVDDLSRFRHNAVWSNREQKIVRSSSAAVGSGSLSFDGTANKIVVASHEALSLEAGRFSQVAWIYPESNDGPIIDSVTSHADRSTAYPFIHVVNGRQLRLGFGDGSTYHSYTSADLLTPNQWNFVAITFDGTSYKIYVNGQLVETTTQFDGLKPSATTQFHIGQRNDGTPLFFKGRLDEVAIYRHVLTAERIAMLRLSGWQPVTLPNSGKDAGSIEWSTTVPDGLSGTFQIRLLTEDENRNRSYNFDEVSRWSGVIDTVRPPAAEMSVLGNGAIIEPSDTIPTLADHTDFGGTTVGGTISRTFTISNSGSITLSLTAIEIGGPDKAEFEITQLPQSAIAPSGTTTFVVSFTPSQLGAFRANVAIGNNGINRVHRFDILGNGLTPSDLSVLGNGQLIINGDKTPDAANLTDFGELVIGQAVSHTFVISNAGQSALTVESILLSGDGAADYTVSLPSNSVIAGDSSTEFVLEFRPTVIRQQTVTVTVKSDDPDSGDYTFAVTGAVRGQIFLPIINGPSAPASPVYPDLVIDSLSVVDGNLTGVIKNIGEAPVVNPFWIDLYLNPTTPPSQANQVWPSMAQYGAVWGIDKSALPLNPGETLTITVGDQYYQSVISQLPGRIEKGAILYVQVDSANAKSDYGAVQETHEVSGEGYNNISRVTLEQALELRNTRH